MHHLFYSMIAGNVARVRLESDPTEVPISVTLGCAVNVPVQQFERQCTADWQMSEQGSSWATIRCGRHTAIIGWEQHPIYRGGTLPIAVQEVPNPALLLTTCAWCLAYRNIVAPE